MDSNLGKMAQKSRGRLGKNLENLRVNRDLGGIKRRTFALLERGRDVRRKSKVTNCVQPASCEDPVGRFDARRVQKSVVGGTPTGTRSALPSRAGLGGG
jgi:hypothetical protein